MAWEQPRGALPASTAIAPVMDLVKPLLTELQNPWPELLSCLVSTGGTLLKYLVLAEYSMGSFPRRTVVGSFPKLTDCLTDAYLLLRLLLLIF